MIFEGWKIGWMIFEVGYLIGWNYFDRLDIWKSSIDFYYYYISKKKLVYPVVRIGLQTAIGHGG